MQQNTEMCCKYNTTKHRNALKKTEMLCKYSQHNQIQSRAANTHNTNKYRNTLHILETQPNK